MKSALTIIAGVLLVGGYELRGQAVHAVVESSVAYDSQTGLYTYTYTVVNSTTSTGEIWIFRLAFGGSEQPKILSPASPAGWSFDEHNDRPAVSWAATSLGTLPAGTINNGRGSPSPYQIKPGQRLAGFSFKSPIPQAAIRFELEPFRQITAGEEIETGEPTPTIEVDAGMASGSASGPRVTIVSGQPNRDGFVAVVTPADGTVRSAPVAVDVRFSMNGEAVQRQTFAASLNGVNVTALFLLGPAPIDLRAVLEPGSSPLRPGVNTLVVTVQGYDPATQKQVSDIDRILFTAITSNGDVNADGQVNCADVILVRAALGKRLGEMGFDSRADVNVDGIIDVRDLAYVSQRLPVGTRCQ